MDTTTIIAFTYPLIIGTFAQGHPGFAPAQLSPAEGDRRQVAFTTHPIGSFVDGYATQADLDRERPNEAGL